MVKKSIALYDLPQGKHKHFSFILRKKKILSIGWNLMNKTHPWAVKYNYDFPYIHSELMAIRNFPYPLDEIKKCSLVNIRLLKNKKLAISRPCVSCATVIVAFNIGEIFYSTDEESFEEM